MRTRRFMLLSGAGFLSLAAGLSLRMPGAWAAQDFKVTRSDEEWRAVLNADQYAVLRQGATERPFTSLLLDEHRRGSFACAGCALELFSSTRKYDSRTGWPSFWEPLTDAVETEEDASLGTIRTSVHCARCGGHLGHVFNDGPPPTGLRYCMNGVALVFQPSPA
jgi:peptide-methionine (R)-S-oxide reductase